MAADDDNDPPKNPFVRWKKHVDAHIGLTLNGLLGIPAIVTKNFNIHPIDDSSANSSSPGSSNARNSNPLAPSSSSSYLQSGAVQGSSSPSSASTSSSENGNILDDVDAAQLLEWHKFIYYSPYSPLKLQQQQQHHMLPPPIPRDVPFGADPYSFTYTDAFEDLLRASSGCSLLDLATRSYRNLHYQMRYGSSVEPPYVFFHRMHGEKLLDAYFPYTAVPAGSKPTSHKALSADTPNDNVVQAVAALAEREHREPWREQLEGSYEDGYDADHGSDDGELNETDKDRDAYGAWSRKAGSGRSDEDSWFTSRRFHQGGLFDELDRVFRVLSRIIDEDTGVASKNRGLDGGRDESRDADAEDELYTAVRSAYSNAEKSLSTFVKTISNISGAVAGSATAAAKDAIRAQQTQHQAADEQQGETIQTTEDHTDMFGNRHVKTVVRRLDADGNEISRETHYTIRSAEPSEKNNSREEAPVSQGEEEPAEAQQADRQAGGKTPDETKPSGWFWK